MATHYIAKCEHGTIKEQCRCPGEKEIRKVPCFPECPEYVV